MGQVEVLEVLEKSKVPLSSLEVNKQLNECVHKTRKIITELLRHNEIAYFEINKKLAMKFFNSKRKMKLYYVP